MVKPMSFEGAVLGFGHAQSTREPMASQLMAHHLQWVEDHWHFFRRGREYVHFLSTA